MKKERIDVKFIYEHNKERLNKIDAFQDYMKFMKKNPGSKFLTDDEMGILFLDGLYNESPNSDAIDKFIKNTERYIDISNIWAICNDDKEEFLEHYKNQYLWDV